MRQSAGKKPWPERAIRFASMVGCVALGAVCRLWQPDMHIEHEYKPLGFILQGVGYQVPELVEGPGEVSLGWNSFESKAEIIKLVARRRPQEKEYRGLKSSGLLEILDNSIHVTPPGLGEKVKHSTRHSFRVKREKGILIVHIR